MPAHKIVSFCQFLTQKLLQNFNTPPPFSLPPVQNEAKGLHFADVAVTDE
jgi:hypothetical protein